jgi:antitoxin VapB
MASLYIKDAATAERVARIAERLGATKTATVNRALDALERASGDTETPPTDFVEWVKWHRARNPLPPPTGLKADKAFFDEMWGEEP